MPSPIGDADDRRQRRVRSSRSAGTPRRRQRARCAQPGRRASSATTSSTSAGRASTRCSTGPSSSSREYFDGERTDFDLPLDPDGTAFQHQAWDALVQIPFGETISYGEQAVMLGDKNKSRAVGAANGKNPIPIVVPCHRVVGSNGHLTGFAGGLERQGVAARPRARRPRPPVTRRLTSQRCFIASRRVSTLRRSPRDAEERELISHVPGHGRGPRGIGSVFEARPRRRQLVGERAHRSLSCGAGLGGLLAPDARVLLLLRLLLASLRLDAPRARRHCPSWFRSSG